MFFQMVTRLLVRRAYPVNGYKNSFAIVLALFVFAWFLIYDESSDLVLNSFQLFGLIFFMCSSYVIFSSICDQAIFCSTYWYGIIMSMLFFLQYLIVFYWTSDNYFHPISRYLFYGDGTPFLHKPFNSPAQAALFLSIVLLLFIGNSLSMKKRWPLYLFVPAMFLAIAQTGSRSVMFLLVYGWIAYVFLIALHGWINKGNCRHNVVHIFAVSILSGAVFWGSGIMDKQTAASICRQRSFSLLEKSFASIFTGDADDYRGERWRVAFFDLQKSSNGKFSEKYSKSTHNVYIDLLVYKGPMILFFFIGFIIWLLIKEVLLLIRKRNQYSFTFHAAIFVSFLIVVGELYGNPVLHLRYIWVFFGLVMAFVSKDRRAYKRL